MKRNSKFKKYNLTLLILFVCFYAAYVYFCSNFYKDMGPSLWLKTIYDAKYNYSKTINKPKLVLLGGSNVLFSIKAQTLEKELEIPVMNLGTNAGLTLEYLLNTAKRRFIKSGDTILLSLEYELYNRTKNLSEVHTNYIMGYDRDYFDKLKSFEKARALFQVSFKNSIKSILLQQQVRKKGTSEIQNGIYNASNLTKNGDQLKNDGHKAQDFKSKDKVKDALTLPLNYSREGVKAFIDFINWAKANNVMIIFSFPSVAYHKEYKDFKYSILQNDLINICNKNNIPVLETQDILYLDKNMFFDTPYHLNNEGRSIKTKRVLEELKKVL